jgi:hypothetical protein
MAASLARYPGLDLPVYGREVPVIIHRGELIATTFGDADTFIRRIDLSPWPGKENSLRQILDYADESLLEIASNCGAVVVKHQWGLQELGHEVKTPDYRVPEGHRLVAEVEVVRHPLVKAAPLYPTREQEADIDNAVRLHRESKMEKGEPYPNDITPDQFGRGASLTHGNRLHLLDLDLIFSSNPVAEQ